MALFPSTTTTLKRSLGTSNFLSTACVATVHPNSIDMANKDNYFYFDLSPEKLATWCLGANSHQYALNFIASFPEIVAIVASD